MPHRHLGRPGVSKGTSCPSAWKRLSLTTPNQQVTPHLGPQGPPSVTTGHLDSWVRGSSASLQCHCPPASPTTWQDLSGESQFSPESLSPQGLELFKRRIRVTVSPPETWVPNLEARDQAQRHHSRHTQRRQGWNWGLGTEEARSGGGS